jgi:hypothetical protein
MRPASLIAIAAIAMTAGCGSLGSTTAAQPPVSAAPPSSSAPALASAEAQPSSEPCTTHACIVQDLDENLVGLVARDESVTTKAVCYKKTVRYHKAADTYSATCLITYSDGSTATGTGNLLVSAKKVTFEPTG